MRAISTKTRNSAWRSCGCGARLGAASASHAHVSSHKGQMRGCTLTDALVAGGAVDDRSSVGANKRGERDGVIAVEPAAGDDVDGVRDFCSCKLLIVAEHTKEKTFPTNIYVGKGLFFTRSEAPIADRVCVVLFSDRNRSREPRRHHQQCGRNGHSRSSKPRWGCSR